jgi:zinc transport system ATP-binding protein
MPTDLLRCSDLRVGYGGRSILPPIDLTLGSGEFWAVIGRNGSGKTTWFKTMLGLLPPVAGRVERLVPDPRLSYLPQRANIDELYPVRAEDVVAMGTDRRWSFLRPRLGPPPEVGAALEEVGAQDLVGRPFRALSEGQKQRVLLARLVAARAQVAFLDEPTAAMDAVAENEALTLIDRLRQRHGMTVVVVSHYLGVARAFADRALFVDRENQIVVAGVPAEVFAHEVFRSRYGRHSEAPGG